MNSISKGLFYLLLLSCCLLSCTQAPLNFGDKLPGKYSLYIMGHDGKEYLLETNNLDSGILVPEQEGAELDIRKVDRSVLVKRGYYYHLDRKSASFIKYRIEGRNFSPVSAMPLEKFSVENYHWIGLDTLLLTGLGTPEFAQVKYVLLDTRSMKQLAAGDMDIPRPSGRFDNMSVGFVAPQRNSLLIGYTYHQQLSASDYTTSDTTYVTELSYPQMKALQTHKDARSTYPGGVNNIQSSAFFDAAQNYYFMDCPGIALGNRPELPTAVMRINKGAVSPDQTYFFNISAALGNHAYGMWPVGEGKAIIRTERKDLFKGLGDHYSTAHFEFYLIDVAAGKVIKKLALPLDKGSRRECVLVENNTVYISINSDKKGNCIYVYDLKSGILKRGLELKGSTDFILRIDKLN